MENFINRNKKLSLILGVIMALLVGYTVPAKAGNDSENKKSSLTSEDRQFFQEYFSRDSQDISQDHTYYIYDSEGILIYDATQNTEEVVDEKLQSLLIHSNLIMDFDNISYHISE